MTAIAWVLIFWNAILTVAMIGMFSALNVRMDKLHLDIKRGHAGVILPPDTLDPSGTGAAATKPGESAWDQTMRKMEKMRKMDRKQD